MAALARRTVLAVLAFAGITGFPLPTRALASNAPPAAGEGERVNFHWRVPARYVDTVRQNLTYEGSERPETDARDGPLVVFVGAVLLVYLAEAVLALRREIVTGGVVIDTRSPQIEIKNDPRLESEWLIVVGPQGSQVYRKEELVDPTKLAEAIARAK